jgi:DNA-binding response OmpR family regulator
LEGKRILIVEDEPLIALDIADMVEARGAVVVGPAFTLEEAEALVAAQAIDGALLDIDLGRTLVWPLAETLHARGIAFAFVSARCDRPDRPAQLAGCHCIAKPTSEEAILQAIARF